MTLTTQMTKHFKWIVLAAVFLVAAGAAVIHHKNNQQAASDLLPVDYHSLKLNDGWGYEVLVDKKVYIHQDCIPAISAYKKFVSEEEALKIAGTVVARIKQGHPPAVTLKDINDAHITVR